MTLEYQRNWIHQVAQDLQYGFRMLTRNPAFAAVGLITLAVGIGVNTAIFSIVDATLLRPLPFPDSSRLVMVYEGIPTMGYPKMGFSPPDLAVFTHEQNSFAGVGAFRNEEVDISGNGEPQRVVAARLSASLLPTLEAAPLLGRTFAQGEDVPGQHLTILSYGLWRNRFGGDPDIVGKEIRIDRQAHTIIGVMPRDFVFPLVGPENNSSPADLWVPLAFEPAQLADWGTSYVNSVIGRLRPGVSLQQVDAEVEALSRAIVANYPSAIAGALRGPLVVKVAPFQKEIVGSVRGPLLALMVAVAFVFLIACSNVSTLLLSRSATRQREIAIRASLGATRIRLLRQMLSESLLLAVSGGVLGFVLAISTRNLIISLAPPSVPLSIQTRLDGTMLAFALGISCFAAVLFGLAPAIQASMLSVQRSLQEGGPNRTAGPKRHRLQGMFVSTEIALALVLLVGAGLVIRSFTKLVKTRPGFNPENVLTMNIPLARQAYPEAAQIVQLYQRLSERVSNLPGVQSVGLSSDLPLSATEMVSITAEGRNAGGERATPEVISQSWIMGDFFQTMRVPLLQGRWFTRTDNLQSEPVAIVSLSMARKVWPGQDPIGKRIRWGLADPWEVVVGIVGDVNQGPLYTAMAPHVYRPYDQLPAPLLMADPFGDWHALNLSLRTTQSPTTVGSAVIARVHELDAELAVTKIKTMEQVVSSSFAGAQFNMVLLSVLAGTALFLAAIGIYGVLAYLVAQQMHESGIRVALGATSADIIYLFLGRGLRLGGLGAMVGLASAIALTRLMTGLLYGVSSLDPFTYIGGLLVLVAVVVLASYIPARRASRVDAMEALRYE